ncbi:MAG: adenylosuccinate lyase [Candidatus Aegiribacteria sp.]|nr:adenylosuccinate lyase [Candidatus Aegiribacteria sp.]
MIDRYLIPEMEEIWTAESRYARWLRIEILAVEARAEAGFVSASDLKNIRDNASFNVKRIEEIEEVVRHDVIAFLTSVSESLGSEARHIHYGMTSSDILDTCLATQLKDAGKMIMDELDSFGSAMAGLVNRTRGILCIGRSHGMHAEPTTMGLKFAGYYSEYLRCKDRLITGLESACVGKLSGAVGTYAHLDPSVEEFVCRRLGIGIETVSTQVVARDRHADFVYALASIGSLLERFGTEIRHLQRTEVGEVEESFGKGQKGSSAMPHKRNPIISERLCGLARLLRGYLIPSLENTVLWHERDISHSSAERFIFPDSCGIALYALSRAVKLTSNLRVFPDAVRSNIEKAGDRFHSQTILLALIDKGFSRESAYKMVQRVAMEAMEQGIGFIDMVRQDKEFKKILSGNEIEERCALEYHLRNEDNTLGRLGLLPADE